MSKIKNYTATIGGKITVISIIIIILCFLFIFWENNVVKVGDKSQPSQQIQVSQAESSNKDSTSSEKASESSSSQVSSAQETAKVENSSSAPAVDVTSVDFDVNELTLNVGKQYTLTTTITPENATDKSLTWTTTMPDVATVTEDGTIIAKAPGKAYIRATNPSDQRDTCIVTVTW